MPDPYGGYSPYSDEGQEAYWEAWADEADDQLFDAIWDFFFGEDPEEQEQDSGA